jgi:hypothetical protein
MTMCPCPGPPLVESSCFTSCRGQAPTGRHANPSLAGGSDDEAAWHRPVWPRAPPFRRLGIWEFSMSEICWNLSGTDKLCDSYGGGHWVHWIQHKLSVREPGPVIAVTATVDDDGVVLPGSPGGRYAAFRGRSTANCGPISTRRTTKTTDAPSGKWRCGNQGSLRHSVMSRSGSLLTSVTSWCTTRSRRSP